MKIGIINKVPFSSLKPGERGTIDGKPFLRIAALRDPVSGDRSMCTAVSLETGALLSISDDTLVEIAGAPFLPKADQASPGDVWEDDKGALWMRTDSDRYPWSSLSSGALLASDVSYVRRIDVKLVRA